MMEDLLTIMGEQQEPMAVEFVALFVLAAIVFSMRLCRRRLSLADWIVLGVPILSSALIMAQHYFGEHVSRTIWRYHYPMYVSLLVYAGYVLSRMVRGRLALALVLVAASVAWQVGATGRRMCREATRPGRFWAELHRVEDKAAQLISADWKGPARSPWCCERDWYVSSRRPVVFSMYSRVGYACGGRLFIPFRALHGREALPDYCFLKAGDEGLWRRFYGDAGLGLMAELSEGPCRYRLYRVTK